MSVHLLVCQRTDTCQEAAERMREGDVGFLPVMDGGDLVGVVTDRDLVMRHVAVAGPSVVHDDVGSCMTPQVISVRPEDPLAEATRKMRTHGVRRLLVLDQGVLQGVISLDDIFLELGRFAGAALVIQRALEGYRATAARALSTTHPPTPDVKDGEDPPSDAPGRRRRAPAGRPPPGQPRSVP